VGQRHCYGVVVFFDVSPADDMAFLADLQPLVANPYATPETEDLEIRIEPRDRESVVIGVATNPDRSRESGRRSRRMGQIYHLHHGSSWRHAITKY
jgi:hypothetical protein